MSNFGLIDLYDGDNFYFLSTCYIIDLRLRDHSTLPLIFITIWEVRYCCYYSDYGTYFSRNLVSICYTHSFFSCCSVAKDLNTDVFSIFKNWLQSHLYLHVTPRTLLASSVAILTFCGSLDNITGK